MFPQISYLYFLNVFTGFCQFPGPFHASCFPLAPHWGRQRGRHRPRQLVSPSHQPHDLRSHLYLCAALSFVDVQYALKRDNFFHCIGAFFFRLNFTEHIWVHLTSSVPWAFCFDLLWLSAKTSRSTNLYQMIDHLTSQYTVQLLHIFVDWEQSGADPGPSDPGTFPGLLSC
jgi:hypothetical protein